MKSLICTLVLGLSIVSSANAQDAQQEIAPAKRAQIEALLEVTGALDIAKLMSEAVTKQITNALSQTRPDIPAKAFDIVSEEVNLVISEAMTSTGGFVDLIIPVYDKHFTSADLELLIDFYKTPIGQKVVSKMPGITGEAMQIGQRWGQSLGPKIAERVKARLMAEEIEL